MAQQMQTRTSRQATPERWQRALERARFAGVEAKQLAGSGEWIVSSASRPGLAYRTDGIACECEAAMLGGDPVCLHRAAYWFAQGVLELEPEPEPPASAAPVAPLVVLGGWSFADEGVEDDAVAVACAGCGDRIYTDDPSADAYCTACTMPAAEVAALRLVPAPVTLPACETCGFVIRASDGGRCAACRRFYAELDARAATRIGGDAIAA